MAAPGFPQAVPKGGAAVPEQDATAANGRSEQSNTGTSKSTKTRIRSEFPETWLWSVNSTE